MEQCCVAGVQALHPMGTDVKSARIPRASASQNSALARIIHEVKSAKSLLCYKHVVETVFAATEEASA